LLFNAIDFAQLATFAGIWLAAAAAPGANVAFTISISSRFGFWAGVVGALGFASVLFGYMIVVALGLGFAVSQYGIILNMLRWFGVAYLLFLAYRMWNANAEFRLDRRFETASFLKIYAQGGLICLTNPKVVVFIAFIFPQTVNAEKPLVPQLLILGLFGALVSVGVQSVYSFFGHTLGQSVPSAGARRIANRVIATVFVVAAIGLSFANI
jgi:homoserine/homoserine lactone efflux protein